MNFCAAPLGDRARSLRTARRASRASRKGRHTPTQVRNPWGSLEWTGAYSDKSPLWTPELRAAVKAVDENVRDGTRLRLHSHACRPFLSFEAIGYARPFIWTGSRHSHILHEESQRQ